MLKGVIFDYDGVIVNSLEVNFEIYNHICHCLDKPKFDSIKEFASRLNGDWRKLLKSIGIETESERTLASYIYREGIFRMMDRIPVMDGVVEVIRKLYPDYSLGVVTNTYSEFIMDKLREARILKCFDSIVDWESMEKKKPEPDQLLKCMEELGVEPKETIYIGDMENDMVAGNRAGIKTIAVGWGWHPLEKLKKHKPELVATHPDQILDFIKNSK